MPVSSNGGDDRVSRLWLTTWGVMLTVVALASTPVAAHGLHFPKRMDLRVSPGRADLRVTYAVPEVHDSEVVRDRFDLNGDGRLLGDELDGLARYLSGQATRQLEMSVDGERLRLEQLEATPIIEERGAEEFHLGIELRLTAALPGTPVERGVLPADPAEPVPFELQLQDMLPDDPERMIPLQATIVGYRWYRLGPGSAANREGREALRGLSMRKDQPVRLKLEPLPQ